MAGDTGAVPGLPRRGAGRGAGLGGIRLRAARPGRTALGASLLLGGFWAAWHVVPLLQAGHPPGWIAWQCAGTVARRVLIDWLYLNAGHRTVAAVLLHTMDNVSVFAFPVYDSHYDPMITGIVVVAGAALVVALWGRTLARFRFGDRPRPPSLG